MECGDRSSWVRRAVIFSGSASKVRFSISSRQRADRRRTAVRSVYYQLPRCVGSEISESQSQSRPSQRTGRYQRLYSVVLQHASLARASSDVTGRLSQLCRAGSPAAAATQPSRPMSRPRRPPLAPGACQLPAPHQSPRGRTYAPTRPQYKRIESTWSSARRSRSQEALACRKRSLILRGLKRHPRGRAFGGRGIVRSRGCRLSGVGAAQSALRLLHLERVAPLVSGQRCSRAAARRTHKGAPRRAARTHA